MGHMGRQSGLGQGTVTVNVVNILLNTVKHMCCHRQSELGSSEIDGRFCILIV